MNTPTDDNEYKPTKYQCHGVVVFISKQDLKEKKEVSQSKEQQTKLGKWASQHRPISIPEWLREKKKKKKKRPTTYSTGYANYLRFSTFSFFCQLLQLLSQ